MAWKIELTADAATKLARLDKQARLRIWNFLHQRLALIEDPRSLGKALHGPILGEFWRYRVGDYRLICRIEDDRLVVLVLRLGHRREIYR